MPKLNTKKGFTLIETIVAVTILAAAIAGPMTLAASSLRATRDARNELIATHLAEEGVEVIHNIRDNNVTHYPAPAQVEWLKNIFSICKDAGCVIDVTGQDPSTAGIPTAGFVWLDDAVISCSPALDCSAVSPVYFNPETGLYRQSDTPLTSPWSLSPFTRTITVVGIDDPTTPLRQARVRSTVSFRGYGNNIKSISVTDDLYNWFPPLK